MRCRSFLCELSSKFDSVVVIIVCLFVVSSYYINDVQLYQIDF